MEIEVLTTQDTNQPRTFPEVVEGWQEQLLQLDKGNALLYFGSRTRGIRIVDWTPDTLVETLLNSRSGLKFDYTEPRSKRRSNDMFEIGQAEELGEPESYIIPGDLKGDSSPLDLQRRLGNLRRRAREWREEQGLNVLFLALGFLNWIDEDGDITKAPLVLLPCQLDRASPRDPFVLAHEVVPKN